MYFCRGRLAWEPPGPGLRAYLHDLWKHKRLTDRELSTLSWWITQAGGVGVEDLSLDPKVRGDNHARVVTRAFEAEATDRLCLEIPTKVWDRRRGKQVDGTLLLRPPHELIAELGTRSPESLKLDASNRSLWDYDSFTDHMVTRAYGGRA